MAVGQHHDAVHVAGDLLHAVAHQHHGGVLRPVIVLYACQNIVPAAGVKTRRRLVQHQHLRLHGDNAGNGHAALLAAGQLKGGLIQHGLRQAHEGGGGTDAAVDILLVQSHVLRAEGDVLIHRLLKQLVFRVLEHQSHLKPHVPDLLGLRPDILAL